MSLARIIGTDGDGQEAGNAGTAKKYRNFAARPDRAEAPDHVLHRNHFCRNEEAYGKIHLL